MVATLLLVLSGLCLLSAFAWRSSAPVVAPMGALTAVAASFLTMPSGPLALPVAVASGLVAAFGLATALGLLHPPAQPAEALTGPTREGSPSRPT